MRLEQGSIAHQMDTKENKFNTAMAGLALGDGAAEILGIINEQAAVFTLLGIIAPIAMFGLGYFSIRRSIRSINRRRNQAISNPRLS